MAVNGNQFLTAPLTCEKAARLNCIELPKSQGHLSIPCILIFRHGPILLLPGSLPLWHRQREHTPTKRPEHPLRHMIRIPWLKPASPSQRSAGEIWDRQYKIEFHLVNPLGRSVDRYNPLRDHFARQVIYELATV